MTPHKLDYGTELFVDDLLIETKRGVTRTLHPAAKTPEPVLAPEPGKPWENDGPERTKRVNLLGTVLHDKRSNRYQMWYLARMDPDHGHRIPGLYVPRTGAGDATRYMGRRTDDDGRNFRGSDIGDLLCYAESDDGLKWTKPDLGVFDFDDSPNNNIVWDLHGASVFLDDARDDWERYTAIGFCRRYRNIFVIKSPDGIHWNDEGLKQPVIERSNEGPTNVVYDAKADRYLSYMLLGGGAERRHIEYSESEKLEDGWSEITPMLEPSPRDDALGKERYGAIRAEFHNMSGYPYGSIYVGILGVLYVTEDIVNTVPGQAAVDGPIDAQFVYSRDGVNWHHFEDRTQVLPRGKGGEYDSGMILFTAKEPLVEDDEIHWYYTGSTQTHGKLLKDKVMSIGRASWRLDGFVSLDAADGVVETVPLQMPDGGLEVNVDASAGSLAVEVLSPDGGVQSGYSAESCTSIRGDHVRHPVRWGDRGLNRAEQPCRLRFRLKGARLYSFRILPPGD
ncbi:MAG: hypothetical protein OXN17_19105 [Candidatus Poribacteria bacterium]|nr:hypothetical protein [Candidatus Poribacteria bacterium]MDE0502501.1 hypothetical protein [Candidatus Poribacteria bacterium]